jgi:ATP-dependent 26S proteasome regulatory subunit
METFPEKLSNEMPIAAHLEKISLLVKGSKMSDKFFLDADYDIRKVSSFLSCSTNEAILFSIVFTLSFEWNSPDISKIAEYIDCNALKIFSMLKDLENLVKKRLLRKTTDRFHSSISRKFEFTVTEYAFNAISNDDNKLLCNHFTSMNLFEMFDAIREILLDRDNNLLTYSELIADSEQLLACNKELEFVEYLKHFNLSVEEKIIYLYCCVKLVEGSEEVNLTDACKLVSEKFSDIMGLKQQIITGSSALVKGDLIKLEDSFFRSDKAIKLSDKTVHLIFNNKNDLKTSNLSNAINPDNIPYREMFYDTEVQKSVEDLERLLRPEAFDAFQRRMVDNGLKRGITIIFFGEPGTGKTESVYQLARMTGRPIIPIQVGDTKSMWFGESEKNVKKIFDDYRIQVSRNKVVPILLFNEADGVFSKRKGLEHSTVSQTENSIQTIFLQELENLEGILIATTNLTENLDKAFDRRFYYKIKFGRPTVETRAKIWKSKLPAISTEDNFTLARDFDLTGGQIDNVVRKFQIQILLSDTIPFIDEIRKFCEDEKGLNSYSSIGFKKLK